MAPSTLKTALVAGCLVSLLIGGIAGNAHAATYVVSPDGDDAHPGTTERPFRTIQKAADVAAPGDTVRVRAGTYGESVAVKTSGAPGRPIIFEGELGDDGAWRTIVDRSIPVKGWTPAPEVGPGVYKTAALPFVPYCMTLDGRQLARIHDRLMNDGKGFELLKKPADAPNEEGGNAYGANTILFWDGVDILYGHLKGATYIRFRNGDNPEGMDLKAAPDGGGFEIKDQSHIVLRRFLVRGARDSIVINGPKATHNVIEENFLTHGANRVVIAQGAAHNIVRRNKMTLGYYSNGDLGAWGTSSPDRRTALRMRAYRVFKFVVGPASSDDHGVLLRGAGEGNEIHHNHIFNGLIGISAGSTPKLRVHHNVIQNMSSIGILTSEDRQKGVVDGEFHDNLLYDCNINVRIHHYNNCLPGERREYHYRNLSWQPPGLGNHIFVHWTDKKMMPKSAHPDITLYHNTYVGGRGGLVSSGWADRDGGLPGVTVLNNVFSTINGISVSSVMRANEKMMGLIDHNWIGGQIPSPRPAWLREKNILEQGKFLWSPETLPSFQLPADCSARNAGIDLSQPNTFGERRIGPLPGMKPGYFQGAAPHMGALQEGETGPQELRMETVF